MSKSIGYYQKIKALPFLLILSAIVFAERNDRPIYQNEQLSEYSSHYSIVYISPEAEDSLNVPKFERHPKPEHIIIPYASVVPRKTKHYTDPKLLKELNSYSGNTFEDIDINTLTPEQYISMMNSLK